MNSTLDSLLRRWRVNYVAPLHRQSRGFWIWWRDELLELLPENIRRSIASNSQCLFIQISEPELLVFSGTIERMQEIGRCLIDADDPGAITFDDPVQEVVLLLPPNSILQTEVTLPAITEENLREVLAFEMDVLTPFLADQVYYDFSVCARSSKRETIGVQLFVAARDMVDRLLASLQKLDVFPDRISTRHDSSRMHDINLLPSVALRRRRDTTRWLNVGLAATALLLLTTVVTVPLIQKRHAIATLEPQVAAEMEDAKEGTRLRHNIETIAVGSQDLLLKKESQPMVMNIVDEMTRIIPDDTWLTRLDISRQEIQMQGQSQSAASLISLIEASPLFGSAQFRSPVTQIPRTDSERFHLSTEWHEEDTQ